MTTKEHKSRTKHVEFNVSTFTQKHKTLIHNALLDAHKFVLAAGGIRSGKSISLATIVLLRAFSAPNSLHLIAHAQGNVCKRNLFDLTVPETIRILFGDQWWHDLKNEMDRGSPKFVRLSDREIILPNGAKIMFLGLDDPEKIRGLQFSTIWVNEANQVDYQTITTLAGRLSQSCQKLDGSTLATKMLFDLNPTVQSSWEYQLFVKNVVPADGSPLPEHIAKQYHYQIINASDNADNLPKDYFDIFASMSQAQRLRDEHGQWSVDNPNALFDIQNIRRDGQIDPSELSEIVVAIDPAATSHKNSDRTGIIVAGRDQDGHYHVIEDASMKAKPERWAQRAIDLYHKYEADFVVAEKNMGGDMVETVLRAAKGSATVPIKLVHASRGKRVRAEPVSVLYEHQKVFHAVGLGDLEQEMIEFDAPSFRGSPDRVDALVWALTHLSKQSKRAASLTQHNLW